MSEPAEGLSVLHLIAPVRFGGGESLLVNLLRERRPGLREHVACAYASADFAAALEAIGIGHTDLTSRSLGEGVSKRAIAVDLWRWPVLLSRLARLVAETRASLVHVHGFPGILLWRALQAFRRVPGLYTHHFHRGPAGRMEQRILGGAYRACAVRTGVSDVVSRSMEAAFPEAGAFLTVRNCVGDAFFAAAGPAPTQRRLVFVQPARFSPFKNQRLVVEALARLDPAVRARVEVRFAGDGPERSSVEALAHRLGVAGSTRFLGAVPYEQMPRTLAEADFGLFPSELEGFGVGAVECLAVGRPVLALDNALMQEVLGEAGLRVPADRLAEGMAAMVERGAALAPQARARARLFRAAAVKDEYVSLYRAAAA